MLRRVSLTLDLAVFEMDGGSAVAEEQVPSGGVAVLAQALGEVKSQLTTALTQQREHQQTLTEIKTLQTQWATKLEVTESIGALRESLQPVAAQSRSAHERIDSLSSSMVVLTKKVDDMVSGIREDITGIRTEIATAKGATWSLGKLATWLMMPVGAVIGYALPHIFH